MIARLRKRRTCTPGCPATRAGCAEAPARAPGSSAARATSSSRSAITTSRLGRAPPTRSARRACARGRRATRRWRASSATPTAGRRATRFFFPGEQYRPAFLDALAELARARLRRGRGPPAPRRRHRATTLRARHRALPASFAEHGHLSRDPDGRLRYAFIHGNWCLANARADGRWCGVDDELPLLFETGCYADFTFPSAPDECQPNIVNQIYWPDGRSRARAAPTSRASARASARCRRDRILMIEGPLALARRPGKLAGAHRERARSPRDDPGVARRACAAGSTQDIHVEGRPEWVFVKVHTHGAPERRPRRCSARAAARCTRALTARYNDGRAWILHYVTAREMFNIAIAAMDGATGDPADVPRPRAAAAAGAPWLICTGRLFRRCCIPRGKSATRSGPR